MAARSLKAEWGLEKDARREFYVRPSSTKQMEFLKEEKDSIETLVKAKKVFISNDILPVRGFTRKITSSGIIVCMLLEGMDVNKERRKLEKEIGILEGKLERIEKKLSNRDFVEKAPSEVVEKYQKEREQILGKREKINENLESLKGG